MAIFVPSVSSSVNDFGLDVIIKFSNIYVTHCVKFTGTSKLLLYRTNPFIRQRKQKVCHYCCPPSRVHPMPPQSIIVGWCFYFKLTLNVSNSQFPGALIPYGTDLRENMQTLHVESQGRNSNPGLQRCEGAVLTS